MNDQFGRDQDRNQRPSRARDDRNVWRGREDRDEDGGWQRQRDEDASRSGIDLDRDRFGVGYGSWEGRDARGYGRAIYGESGLGEPNRGENYGRNLSQPNRGENYGRNLGEPNRGEDYSRNFSRYGQSSSQYAGPARDNAVRGFAGRGPKDYKRTDERIREDVCDRLSQDDEVDASEISVRVQGAEVTLEGTTTTRRQKHRAEEIAADVFGVDDVHNNIRVLKSIFNELKDKVTGNEEPAGGHAGSGTKTTSVDEANRH